MNIYAILLAAVVLVNPVATPKVAAPPPKASSHQPNQQIRVDSFRRIEAPFPSVMGLPLAPWADGPFVVSEGNTIGQRVPLGWGYR